MNYRKNIIEPLRDLGRFLTFRATVEDFDRYGVPHFVLGLTITWLVGIARNWDLVTAPLFARLGLASVAYIFFMAFLIFAFAWMPSNIQRSYGKVLTVVAMTAAPGLIYGIPVEMFLSVDDAQAVNLAFLAVVALWRVALAIQFCGKGCGNTVGVGAAIIFVPIQILIFVLVGTGRAGYIMDIMGGLRGGEFRDANYTVNLVIANLWCLAWPGIVLALFVYGAATWNARSRPD
ncbi:MAG: hypothetical protein K1X67_03860 [Fimbriimonadaceae bacterium]|nr:hypothetical protein [Fimbriimonadaceae bacterium]